MSCFTQARALCPRPAVLLGCVCAVLAVGLSTGCGVRVGGPLATRLTPAPDGVRLEPAPPDGVYWLHVAFGTVEPNDPSGQPWDAHGLPDPYAVIYAGGEELLRTEVADDNLSPSWQGPRGNFAFDASTELELVVMEDDLVGDRQMLRVGFSPPSAQDLSSGQMVVEASHGKVTIRVGRAHALIGLGFDYVARDGLAHVGAVWVHSPAERAGLKTGDTILRIGERQIESMKEREIRSAINSIGSRAVEMVIKHATGGTENLVLGTGPIYALFEDYGSLD